MLRRLYVFSIILNFIEAVRSIYQNVEYFIRRFVQNQFLNKTSLCEIQICSLFTKYMWSMFESDWSICTAEISVKLFYAFGGN